jgi:GAF domain-containing protein
MADQLQATISNLEQRVAERTRELERQTLRMRTAAEVARDVTVAPSLDELLERAAKLMLERFGLSEVGIFLLDDKKEFAVLRASPTDAGKRMMRQGHRVRIGDKGVVGEVAATGEASLASAAAAAPASMDAPRLQLRSQLAMPLRTHEGLIGVLDLQSAEPGAFAHGDSATMQVLADQLAPAVERSRLLLQVQDRLGQLEQSSDYASAQGWGAYSRKGGHVRGYTYNNVRLDPITTIPPAAQAALEQGEALVGKDSGAGRSAAVPIKLRDRVLGVVHVNFQPGGSSESTVALIQQAADRLGSALENVRLLEDSQRRASNERRIGEITTKISSSINMQNVLQTAVEELGRALPGSDVRIKLHRERHDREQEMPT